MKALDINASYLGVTAQLLMENAGAAVAEVVRSRAKGGKVVIVAGLGGNGGDGLVAARHLAATHEVRVFLLGDPKVIRNEGTLRNWEILQRMYTVKVFAVRGPEEARGLMSALSEADVIVDAILGTGVKGAVSGLLKDVIEAINSSKGLKVAVDVPSGLDPDEGKIKGIAVKADVTVTFHAPKLGLLNPKVKGYVGELVVKPIGMPPDAELLCGPGDFFLVLKERRPWSRKGDFGKVLVIGGSRLYSGAPALSAMAALRAGADIAVIACPSSVANVIRGFSPNLIVRPVGREFITEDDVDELLDLAEGFDSIVIGPGLGLEEATKRAVASFVKGMKDKPLVVDADALKAVALDLDALKGKKVVLTPHAGEFKLLTGTSLTEDVEERREVVQEAASMLGATILLKGHVDIISDGRRTKLNKTGNPGMTVGGTGDVLTGITATFLAWSKDPFESACAAAFLNGLAGDLALKELGHHMMATDIIERIPKAIMAIYPLLGLKV